MTQDQIVERQYAKLVQKLIAQLDMLERIGENDMGILLHRLAGRYHAITRNFRALVNELSQDAYFPEEPLGDDRADVCSDCGVGAGEHANDCPRLEARHWLREIYGVTK